MSRAEEIRYLESKLEDNPDSVLFARLADRYIELERLDDAIELCKRGIERQPRYATAYLVLAEAYWKKGDLNEAETAVSKALELEPHNLRALHLRAEIQRATGWIANAEQDYRTILALDPLTPKVKEELKSLQELEAEVVAPSELEFAPGESAAISEELQPEVETAPSEELADEEVEGVISEIFETESEEEELIEAPEKTPEEELREIFETEEEEPAETEKTAPTAAAPVREEAPSEPEPEKWPPEPEVEERPSKPETGHRPSIVTPTLGEIYAAQGQYAKAIGVFQVLKEKDPDNPEWDRKIEMLKKKLAEQEERTGNEE